MELWRVVAAVFVVSTIVMLPAQVVLWSAAGEAFGHLPGDGLPNGEILLILVELLVPVWPTLATAVVSGWFALWLWTVLWHAGVVRWLVFSGRRGVRLAEILSRGVLHWWRWARLGLTSVIAIGLSHTAIALVYGAFQDRVAGSATDLLFGLWLVSESSSRWWSESSSGWPGYAEPGCSENPRAGQPFWPGSRASGRPSGSPFDRC